MIRIDLRQNGCFPVSSHTQPMLRSLVLYNSFLCCTLSFLFPCVAAASIARGLWQGNVTRLEMKHVRCHAALGPLSPSRPLILMLKLSPHLQPCASLLPSLSLTDFLSLSLYFYFVLHPHLPSLRHIFQCLHNDKLKYRTAVYEYAYSSCTL